MISISGIVEEVFSVAIRRAYPDLEGAPVMIQGSSKFADYQCNSAMSIVGVGICTQGSSCGHQASVPRPRGCSGHDTGQLKVC